MEKMGKAFTLPLSKDEIVSLYENGSSVVEIGAICNCSPRNITYLLRRLGVSIRDRATRGRTYALDESCLDRIDSHDAAYLLGLALADGYNNESRHEFVLRVAEKDIELIEFTQRFFKTDKPIQRISSQSEVGIAIQSQKISRALAANGCIQNKTHSCEWPSSLPPSMFSSFMLGYFDGDGGVTISNSIRSNVCFHVTGHKPFLLAYQRVLIDRCDLGFTVLYKRHKERKNEIYTLRYCGANQLEKIMNFLYREEGFSLSRKKEKFAQAISGHVKRKHE